MNVTYKDDAGFVAENLNYKLVFDFKSLDVITLYKDGKSIPVTERMLDKVLDANLNRWNWGNNKAFEEAVCTENNRYMYEHACTNYAKMNCEYVKKVSRALIRLACRPYIQILIAAGVPKGLFHEIDYTCNRVGTTPHDILGMPKSIFNIVKEADNYSLNAMKIAKELIRGGFDINTVQTIMNTIKEESSFNDCYRLASDLINLRHQSGYTDLPRLLKYLLREVKLQQGITRPSDAAQLLMDYIRMAGTIKHIPDRYPDSLKKVHDIMAMNYKVALDTRKEEIFKDVVSSDSYKMLEYEAKNYCIVSPSSPKNLVEEGKDLGHCVASYVNDVLESKCKIFFLRYLHMPESSLVTVEVRGNNIRQIKGRLNRPPTEAERNFVKLWAEEKELEVASGY